MKKKGFTLIELIVVIVILGIIVLIATPLVLKYIEYSKKAALKNNIMSIDRAILMYGTINRKDKEYTSLDELKIEINDLEMNVQYVDGINRFYKIENDMYKLDIKKCKAKKYCTIGEIKSIEDIIISTLVNDSNPGIICGEGLEEDTALNTCYIKSIEDLVAFSTLVNKGISFKDKTIELVYSLDFNKKNSYANRKVNNALISETGFPPIGGSKGFQGTFNGNDNTINGLYINSPTYKYAGLFSVVSTTGIIKNLTLENSNITANRFSGSLIGRNQGTVKNVNVKTVQIKARDYFVGGVVGENDGTINGMDLEDISVDAPTYHYVGGLTHSNSGIIKNVVGNNITVKMHGNSGGLVATNSGTISQVILTNVNITGQQQIGGLVGLNNSGSITNSKVEIDMKANQVIGLAIGAMKSGTLNTVVVKGSITANNTYIGGLVGQVNAASQEKAPIISGVYLSGNLNCAVNSTRNRIVGATGSYLPVINALVASGVTIGGNTVESTDPTSKHGKSLDNMGKASQSEYEALGFEFESTDTNEAYWCFDENDELDLIIK